MVFRKKRVIKPYVPVAAVADIPRRVLPTATDHAFARLCTSSTPFVAGLHNMLWYTDTSGDTACLLTSRQHPGNILGGVTLNTRYKA